MTKLFPEAVNSHVLARYWFCAEECRLRACEGIKYVPKKATEEGLTGHKWLEQRPKSKSWLNVMEKLKTRPDKDHRIWFDYIGLAGRRKLGATWVIAHPDDFDVFWRDREIRFIENKTIRNVDWRRYLGPVARQQLEITTWVFEPLLEAIKWKLCKTHFIYWWDRDDMWPLGTTLAYYDAEKVEGFLTDLFAFFRGERELIPPAKFKCRTCRGFKKRCRIWLQRGGTLRVDGSAPE